MATSTVYSDGKATTYTDGRVTGVVTGPGAAAPNNAPKVIPASSYEYNQKSQPNFYGGSNATSTPTVFSNANIIEKKIPEMNSKASTLLQQEPTTLSTTPAVDSGLVSNDYATSYKKAYDGLPAITDDPQYQADMAMINSLQTGSDATTSAYVNSIQKNYADLTTHQEQANDASTKRLESALLRGGSTRYAPVSSGGILDLKTRSDIQGLATLHDQENQKIAEVKQAQQTQNYNLMSKRMDELDTLTEKKRALAKSIADTTQKQNEKLRTGQIQASRDNAIAGLVEQGVTNPTEILSSLNDNPNGQGDFTIDEVSKALTAIQKNTGIASLEKLSGGVGSFYTLKETGNLPASITSLPEDQQLFSFLKQFKAATVLPKTSKSSAVTTHKPIISGGLTYTSQDYTDDSKILEASRGQDNYVDSSIYKKLYDSWVNGGGKPADFIKTYPPKTYVNPKNVDLPTFLRPAASKASTESTNPFG